VISDWQSPMQPLGVTEVVEVGRLVVVGEVSVVEVVGVGGKGEVVMDT